MRLQERHKQRRQVHYQRRIGAASDKGPVRPANEDAYFIPGSGVDTGLGVLYIVADGVGGQEHGRDAADLAVQSIPTNFYQMRQNESNLADSLNHALKQANEIIYGEAQRREAGRMGCTVVAAAQHQNQLFIAHVGDARAYLARKGRLKLLTRDHSWVQDQVEAGTLTAEEAASHELRNVVTRVLGNEPDVEIELSGPFQADPGDAILLCSDGLYDVVPQNQIYKTLTSMPPGQAAGKLVRAAVQAGAHDNVTAVVAAVGRSREQSLKTLLAYPLPGGIPLFLPIVLSILIVALGLLLVLGSLDSPEAATNEDSAEPGSAGTTVLEADSVGGLSSITTTLAITNSALLTGTGVITAIDPSGAQLAATPTLSPTGTFTSTLNVLGCIELPSFFWPDELYSDDEKLCEPTPVFWPEDDPNAILLTDYDSPESILGWVGDGGCVFFDFIKVQSKSRRDLVGWVTKDKVSVLKPGQEVCPDS